MPHLEITTSVGCRVQCTFCPQNLLMTRYEEKTDENKITFARPVMMSFDAFKPTERPVFKNTFSDVPGSMFIGRSAFVRSGLKRP